jgi:uncharacterized protein YkwD
MSDRAHSRGRRLVFAASPAAMVLVGMLLPASAQAACANTSAAPAATAASAMRGAVLCLVNEQRARRGLGALRADARVTRAAGRHARDMVARRYFAHQRPGGPDLGDRLRAAGVRWRAAGEAIAYGCGPRATPRATVRAWMNSPPHRAILLSRSFGSAGVGVANRAPVSCDNGATWVLNAAKQR